MDGDHGDAPLPERARSSSWGGPDARAELRRIAEDARLRTGFGISAIEVLRGDGLLELVAFTGSPVHESFMGKSSSLSHMRRVVEAGTSYGKFVFLAEEDMDAELQDDLRGYGFVPNVRDSRAPDRWRSLDMLVAPLTDRSGRTRALLHLDEPLSGRRLGPQELGEMADGLELVLQSVMATVEREELTRQARLGETARDVVRAAADRLSGRDLLTKVHPQLVAGFRATSLEVRLYDQPDELPTGRGSAGVLPSALGPAVEAATRRAWASRTVIIAEPGRVWGDDELDRNHRDALSDHLAAHVASELLLVPVGAGHEPMGVLIVLRDNREDRWTESESQAALGVGHDVGRALLSARAHEREQQLIGELQRLDEYRRELIDTVSHELRTPLTSIIGYLDLVTELAEPIPERAQNYLEAVSRNTDRLLLLVTDLRSASEVENGPLRLAAIPTDVAALARLSLDDIQQRATGAGLTLVRDLPPELTITADPGRLLQVLDNLLSNAIKFTPPGGRITVSATRNGDGVDLVVRDTGIGIDADSLPHLGTALFRTPRTGQKGIPGIGLGLTITKNIVEAHHGTLTISSREHEGTTVQVHLPTTPSTAAAAPELSSDTAPSQGEGITSTETASDPDSGEVTLDAALVYLRDEGDQPLMYSFPQGAVVAFDQDLRYLSAGGLGLAQVGLSREMMEGKTIFEVFPEETTTIIEPLYRSALGGTPTTWEVPYDGRTYTQFLAPVTNASGEIVAGLGFIQDVTEARAAEHALKESEERNRLTFEHAPIGQALVELDGTWRQVNAALTKLTGYSEEQLLQLTFQDITHPDDLELDLEHMNKLLAGEIGSYQIEKRYRTASGHIVWALLTGALARDEDDSPLYFIAQVQDITDRKHQQQALQDLTEMLAHDLRTPAAVMLGFAELLEGPAGSDVQEVRAYAARISGAARAMTDLLDNALTATALDSGQLIASPQDVALRGSLATTIQNIDLSSVSIDASGLDDVSAWMDPVHLTQVITNLLTNAAKYGGDQVTVSATSSQDRVSLSIADNGPGVEPEFVPYLFDRFSRSATVRGGRQRGSGLGLYIVRDLLAANGGTIQYASSPSGGAEFRIELCATRGTTPHTDEITTKDTAHTS